MLIDHMSLKMAIIILTHIFHSQVHIILSTSGSSDSSHEHHRLMKLCVKYLLFILDFKYSNCLVKIQLARRVSYLEF